MPCSTPPAARVGLYSQWRRRGHRYSLHAGQVTVADGTKEMADRIERVLTNDPGIGVARHVDAGYPEAIDSRKKSGVKNPMS